MVVVATAAAVAIDAPVPVVGKIAVMEAARPVAVTAVAELLAVETSLDLLMVVVLKTVAVVAVGVVLPRMMVEAAVMAAAVMVVEMITAVTAAPKAEQPICSVHR